MLINYDENGEHITPCPMKEYDDFQLAFVGDKFCLECAFNLRFDFKKVDCSFMDCDEGRKISIIKMFSEDDTEVIQNQAYQAASKSVFEEYEKKTIQWSERVGLRSGSTLEKQCLKSMAEFGETMDAILLNDPISVEMEMGDHLVTLVQICDRYFEGKKTLANCLKMAYEKISVRTGKMIDGNFVKD